VLAIADKLQIIAPHSRLVYAIGKGDKLADIPNKHSAIDTVITVRAGKFRRYHGEGWRQVLDIITMLKNIRDFFFVLIGFFQSLWQLKRLQPDVIFIKGGFVAVPIGLAAALLRIPYITHDSDAVPGLANRIISRWARIHAVGQPVELYKYPPDKTRFVGVPTDQDYAVLSVKEQIKVRETFHIPAKAPIVCVTGGGLGADVINKAIVSIATQLFTRYPDLWILHQAGRSHEQQIQQAYKKVLSSEQQRHIKVLGFVPNLAAYSGIADLIVCRAGATTLADFAMQKKACVVIPNPLLTGGHQLKNVEPLQKKQAIVIVDEQAIDDNVESLYTAIISLLDNPKKRRALAEKLHQSAMPKAAENVAELLVDTVLQTR